jgi:hypothetical protein
LHVVLIKAVESWNTTWQECNTLAVFWFYVHSLLSEEPRIRIHDTRTFLGEKVKEGEDSMPWPELYGMQYQRMHWWLDEHNSNKPNA